MSDFQAFEKQPLERVEIEFTYRSISRSRHTLEKTWLVDNGSKSLCRLYRVYTLKNPDLTLEIHDAGVYEENDWEAKRKKIVFYVPSIQSVVRDGEQGEPGKAPSGAFQTLEIRGPSLRLTVSKPGMATRKGQRVSVIIAGTIG
jgi:hypothetical protein